MILATALVLQRLLTFHVSSRESVFRTVVLWIAVAAFGILHCRINDLNVHSTVFGAMVLYVGHCTRVMMKSVKNAERKERAGRLAASGSGTFFWLYAFDVDRALEPRALTMDWKCSMRSHWVCLVGDRLNGL